MKRLVVLGGRGFFGAAAVDLLREHGLSPRVAARRPGADLQIDAERPAGLQAGDVVIDAAGPFQGRTTALVEDAIRVGYDVIDLSDSLAYAQKLLALRPAIDAAGIRVLTGCSSVSAVSAAMVRRSGIREPVRVTGFLAPAVRFTAHAGAGGSLLGSVGRRIRVRREGRLIERRGWIDSRSFDFPPPLGRVRGNLFETADSVLLPAVWPGLRTADFFVYTNLPGLNAALAAAARWPSIRAFVERRQAIGMALARRWGSPSGMLAFEIEGDGRIARAAVTGPGRAYLTPVVPAVLAARAILEGRFEPRGWVPADRQADPDELVRGVEEIGMKCLFF